MPLRQDLVASCFMGLSGLFGNKHLKLSTMDIRGRNEPWQRCGPYPACKSIDINAHHHFSTRSGPFVRWVKVFGRNRVKESHPRWVNHYFASRPPPRIENCWTMFQVTLSYNPNRRRYPIIHFIQFSEYYGTGADLPPSGSQPVQKGSGSTCPPWNEQSVLRSLPGWRSDGHRSRRTWIHSVGAVPSHPRESTPYYVQWAHDWRLTAKRSPLNP